MSWAYWLGKFETGSTVLFDPLCQESNSPYVLLFVYRIADYRSFQKSKIRSLLSPILDRSEKLKLLMTYKEWLLNQQNVQIRIQAILQLREDTTYGTAELRQRHQKHLRKIGKKGAAVTATTKKHRASHCYACKAPLTSDSNLECTACRWLICACGACGCGYSDIKTQNSARFADLDFDDEFEYESVSDRSNEAEMAAISKEGFEYAEALAASEESGWFYPDEDHEETP